MDYNLAKYLLSKRFNNLSELVVYNRERFGSIFSSIDYQGELMFGNFFVYKSEIAGSRLIYNVAFVGADGVFRIVPGSRAASVDQCMQKFSMKYGNNLLGVVTSMDTPFWFDNQESDFSMNAKKEYDNFLNNHKQFIVIRGIPGAGKSTLAGRIKHDYNSRGFNVDHYEADMYFMFGEDYKFDPAKLKTAHNWCFNMTSAAISDDYSTDQPDIIIVSNTFTTLKEIERYLECAYSCNVPTHIIHCSGDYGSIHNVPEDTMNNMRARFVPNETIVKDFNELYDAVGFKITHEVI